MLTEIDAKNLKSEIRRLERAERESYRAGNIDNAGRLAGQRQGLERQLRCYGRKRFIQCRQTIAVQHEVKDRAERSGNATHAQRCRVLIERAMAEIEDLVATGVYRPPHRARPVPDIEQRTAGHVSVPAHSQARLANDGTPPANGPAVRSCARGFDRVGWIRRRVAGLHAQAAKATAPGIAAAFRQLAASLEARLA